MSAVSFQNLSKTFPDGTRALRGVDLEIAEGEFIALVGPSGCGKTTLLRILAGLDGPSAGTVLIGGTDASGLEPGERDLAMVFQNYALFPHLSVFENLAFGLRARKRPKDEVDQAVRGVADRLGLSGLLKRKPGELSGGQRQRVALGRLLSRNPAIHLLDEPLSNLDANLRSSMRDELARLHREHGRTTLYVTHDQVEAMTLADDIFVLRGGVVQQAGTPLTLYDDPDNRFVAGFIGSPAMNFLRGKVTRRTESGVAVAVEDGELDVRVEGAAPGEGTDLVVGVRPEHLAPVESGGFTAQVEMSEELGGNSYVHSTPPSGGGDIVFERRGARDRLTGQTVRLGAEPGQVFAFTPDGVRVR